VISGCAKRLVVLAVLIAVLAAAWLQRERLVTAWHDLRGTAVQPQRPSPELAAIAEEKIDRLRAGDTDRAVLSSVELESLLLFRYNGVLPGVLHTPAVELDGDRLRLRARVPLDMLPHVDGWAEVAAFLPDTTELAVTGRLLPLDGGRVAFAVDQVSASRVPLPARMVPPALTRLGRGDEPGLPPDAMALPLPPGMTAAYIRRDSLVLLARPRNDRPGN
jgi:hypothetical protein